MSSSVFTSSSPQIAALLADIASKVGITEHDGLVAIKTYLDSLAAAPAVVSAPSTPVKVAVASEAPAAPKKRKAPAGGAGAAAATVTALISVNPTEDDPLRNHKYRLQTINPALCMGRKVDLKNQIVGTRKDDTGSNGIFWPEKQCTKAPEAGEALCRFCKEKDDEVKSGKAGDKHWFGRLDEPIYYKAGVVGCGDFFAKYPHGIPGDASTAPPAGFVVKTPAGAVAAKKRGPKPKTDAPSAAPTTPVTHAPEPVPAAAEAAAPVPAAPAPPAAKKSAAAAKPKKATVAKTASAPVVAEWAVLMFEGRVVARNTQTNYVYEVDADIIDDGADIGKIVKKDDYIGVWKNGAVDAYDLSGAVSASSDNEEDSEDNE